MQAPQLTRRVGWAALAAGALTAVSVGAELLHRVERDTIVVERPVFAVYLALYGLGMMALAAAVLGLRRLHHNLGRPGRVGVWIAFTGAVLNILFAAVHGAIGAATGETADAFVLFGLGMLMLIAGQVLLALGLRRAALLGRRWLFPLAGAAGLVVAIVVFVDPIHDLGLFAFFGSWAGLGLSLLRGADRPLESTARRRLAAPHGT